MQSSNKDGVNQRLTISFLMNRCVKNLRVSASCFAHVVGTKCPVRIITEHSGSHEKNMVKFKCKHASFCKSQKYDIQKVPMFKPKATCWCQMWCEESIWHEDFEVPQWLLLYCDQSNRITFISFPVNTFPQPFHVILFVQTLDGLLWMSNGPLWVAPHVTTWQQSKLTDSLRKLLVYGVQNYFSYVLLTSG